MPRAGREERFPSERYTGETRQGSEKDTALLILTPVFNDWIACRRLLDGLDKALAEHGLEANVLVVDDGSAVAEGVEAGRTPFRALRRIDILRLRRNLGHQRAIAIGLAYIEEKVRCTAVVVMDSDGEDDPQDVPRLYRKFQELSGQKIVFAERTVRSESYTFRAFYWLYRVIHLLLTSRRVRVGNFSVIPAARLSSLVAVSELWSHYAAAVYKSRQPLDMIPARRAKRLHGEPRMKFVDLVVHGLSAIAVYSEAIGVRLLAASSLLILLALAGMVSSVAIRLTTDVAIPGWATYTVGFLLVVVLQAVLFSLVFSFIIISGRDRMTFLPIRDYRYFIAALTSTGAAAPSNGTATTGPVSES